MKKIFIFLLLFVCFIGISKAETIENFDNLNLGDIDGQNGWSRNPATSGTFDVVDSNCFSGKCFYLDPSGQGGGYSNSFTKSLNNYESGIFSYKVRPDSSFAHVNFLNFSGTELTIETLLWGQLSFGKVTFGLTDESGFGLVNGNEWNDVYIEYDKENSRVRGKTNFNEWGSWKSLDHNPSINLMTLDVWQNIYPSPCYLDEISFTSSSPEESDPMSNVHNTLFSDPETCTGVINGFVCEAGNLFVKAVPYAIPIIGGIAISFFGFGLVRSILHI